MSILDHRLSYLGTADMDYLAARHLINSGLAFSGMPKAAEAIEKIIKLFLILEATINGEEELQAKDLKKYSHNINKLFKELRKKTPTLLDDNWDGFVHQLQESYVKRYPDQWSEEMQWAISIHNLDGLYAYLRGNIVRSFPFEEQEKVKIFGVNILQGYDNNFVESITNKGGMSPIDILKLNNKSIELFNFKYPGKNLEDYTKVLFDRYMLISSSYMSYGKNVLCVTCCITTDQDMNKVELKEGNIIKLFVMPRLVFLAKKDIKPERFGLIKYIESLVKDEKYISDSTCGIVVNNDIEDISLINSRTVALLKDVYLENNFFLIASTNVNKNHILKQLSEESNRIATIGLDSIKEKFRSLEKHTMDTDVHILEVLNEPVSLNNINGY